MRLILAVALALLVAPGWDAQQTELQRAEQAVTDGKYEEGERVAQRLIAEADAAGGDAAGGKASADLATALDLLAKCGYVLGKSHDSAVQAAARRSLAIRERLYGPDSRAAALSLHTIAALLVKDGQDEAARAVVERQIGIYEKDGRPNANHAAALDNLGNIHVNLGNGREALKMYGRALEVLAKATSGETRMQGNILGNQSLAYRMEGDLPRAKAAVEKALGIFERVLPPEHPLLAYPLKNLGTLLLAMNEPRLALTHLERAQETVTKNASPNYVFNGSVMLALGQAKAASGQETAGLELVQRAIAQNRRLYGDFHPNLMTGLPNLAILLARAGEAQKALDAALESVAIGSRYVENTLPGLPEREAVLNSADCYQGMHAAMSILAANRSLPVSAALAALIRSRGRVLDEMGERRRTFSSAVDPQVALLWRELAEARERLSQLAMRQTTAGELAQASDRKQLLERRLSAAHSAFARSARDRSIGPEEVLNAIGPGTALVSYVRFDDACVHVKPGCRPFSGTPPKQYMALVTTRRAPGREPVSVAVPLGDAAGIDALVKAVREQVAQEAENPGLSPKRSEAAYRKAALALRQRIWDPLLPVMAQPSRIYIVPDGALHLIHFGAFPQGPAGYLMERGPLLHTLNAERDLAREGVTTTGSGLLAVGDPLYDRKAGALVSHARFRGTTAKCGDFAGLRFGPLPASSKEVAEVARVWKRTEPAPVSVLSQALASEEAVKSEASGKRVLHLASHGFFVAGCGAQQENPLLRSGLALTGANLRKQASVGEEDGILTAEEIASLELAGVEWAVLSACETGLGEIQDGEGVFGLRRAFQIAGVRSVIMSLWPVDDEASRKWMRALYEERFQNRKTTAEAARAASLRILRQRREAGAGTHPWYWASFVASGDWR